MRKIILFIIGVIMTTTITQAAEFKPGQIWEYKNRTTEAGSTLVIVKIDEIKNERIIHIGLQGLKIKNPTAPKGYSETISHLPITEKALTESVVKMSGTTNKLPDFQEGYNIWKEAMDNGKGGYFTIPVSQCVEYMEKAINQ